jgi:hypothetical protein
LAAPFTGRRRTAGAANRSKYFSELEWACRYRITAPVYTIRAELERGGFSVKRASTATEALLRLETMEGLNIEIAGPLGEKLTRNELLVRVSREARTAR